MTAVQKFRSPVGSITLVAEGPEIIEVVLPGEKNPPPASKWTGEDEQAVLDDAQKQILDYMHGRRSTFEIPTRTFGTDFQERVWDYLRSIPYGQTRNYGQVARAIGQPGAARAVGQANAENPLPIIVPCHRVIKSDGGMGGYMGQAGENAVKAELLRREGGNF